MKHVKVYADGGSRGNPGPSALGVVIKDSDGAIVKELSKYLGETTNNVAEYSAVIYGLQEALFLKAEAVTLYVDSELVARQLSGVYKVKSDGLKPLVEQALHLIGGFKKFEIQNIPREKNSEADKLVNKALNLSSLI